MAWGRNARFAALLYAALFTAAAALGACTEEVEPPEPEDTEPPAAADGQEPGDEPDDEVSAETDEDPEERAAAELQAIAAQVSVLRELPLLDDVDVRFVAPERIASLVRRPPPALEGLRRAARFEPALAVLGQLPQGTSAEEYERLVLESGQVWYDEGSSSLVVSADPESLTQDHEAVAARELTHALQDQHFGLAMLARVDDDDNDGALALRAVLAGDALVLEEEWAAAYQSPENGEDVTASAVPVAARAPEAHLDEMPPYLRALVGFPLDAGERFVAALISEGGYSAVDSALQDPPRTTLEILDPDRYVEGFEADDVAGLAAPERDWAEGPTTTFGAFDLLELFNAAAGPDATAGAEAWPAWRGGLLQTWEGDGATAVGISWAFEDEERAEAVCAALPHWYAEVAGAELEGEPLQGEEGAMRVRCESELVRFVIAPDTGDVEALLP